MNFNTWEKISLENQGLQIIRENPSKNYFHPCSANQINSVLDQLPNEFISGIRAIILRRISKMDQQRLVDARKTFRCIILNSFRKNLKMIWTYKPDQKMIKHMEPWCNRWNEENGNWILQWNHSEIRRYYLYHVLLHEVGHFNDSVHNKKNKREGFAENFALEWAKKLRQF